MHRASLEITPLLPSREPFYACVVWEVSWLWEWEIHGLGRTQLPPLIILLFLSPVLWPPHAKSWFIGKDSDAGRDWGQEEKGTTEDEMAGWHHWLDGHESEWTPEVGDGQGGLACCDSWGRNESDMTDWLNWTDSYLGVLVYGEWISSCFTLLGVLTRVSKTLVIS